MKKSILFSLFFMFVCAQTQAQAQTLLEKAKTASYQKLLKMYAGNRIMTLQWLNESATKKAKSGKVITKAEAGSPILSMKGEQRKDDANFLLIDGTMQPVSATEFLFSGTITTKVSYLNDGKECVKEGNFTFRKYPERAFYRLQEKENCSGEVNYVDIF